MCVLSSSHILREELMGKQIIWEVNRGKYVREREDESEGPFPNRDRVYKPSCGLI